MPKPRLELPQELQDLRLDGDVERRRRLVRDQEVGLVGERHRDHHPLALAARELVRIRVEPRARPRAGRPGAGAPASAPAPRARSSPLWTNSTSLICFSIVWSGLSDVIGSWKIMRDPVAAHAPERRLVGAQQLLALEPDAAGRDGGPAGRAGAGGWTARSRTSPSRSRPRARRSRPSRCRARRRARPAPRRPACRTRPPGRGSPAGAPAAVTRSSAGRTRRGPPRR